MAAATLYDYWMICYRRRWMVGLTTLSAIAAAILGSLILPKIYESVCEFYIVFESRSSAVSLPATPRQPGPLVLLEIEKWYRGLLESQSIRELVHESTKAKDIHALRRDVEIEFTRNHIVRVRVRDRDANAASDVANAYPAALSDFLARVDDERELRSAQAIAKSLTEIDAQLGQVYQELRGLLAEKHSPSVVGEIQRLLDRKASLESSFASATARLGGIEKRIALTTDQAQAEAQRSSTLAGTVFSPSIQRLLREIADIEADLAAARAEFDGKQGDRHPRVRTLSARLAQRNATLERELESIRKSEVREPDSLHEQLRKDLLTLYKDRATAQADAAATKVELDSLARRVDALQNHGLREQEIRAEIERLERSRGALRQRDRDRLTQSAAEPAPVVVVMVATPSAEPKFPLPLFNALVAAFLGLTAGIYVALAYDYVARARFPVSR